MASSGFGSIFRGTNLSLVKGTGEIHLGESPSKFVRAEAVSPLLLRALERCGVGVDPQAAVEVSADVDGGYAASGQKFASIYLLSQYLKELK